MKIYKVLILSILLLACSNKQQKDSRVDKLPYYNDASFTPQWGFTNGGDGSSLHTVPDFSLINQYGDTITQVNLKDKVYVVNFFFTTCPGICPKMTENMLLLQDSFLLEDKVVLLSHSVMPSVDSVAAMLAYGEAKGVVKDKWHLLTGDREEIYHLGRNVYFVEENLGVAKSEDDFLHTENIVLIDSEKHIRGIYNSLNKTSMQQLIADVHLLLLE